MEITFKNITQELEAHRNDPKQCESMILNVLSEDPRQLPDPAALCQVLKSTDYYQKEAVYELEDYFQLHEIHPIHLLLSLQKGTELYSGLYSLYEFQETTSESTWLSLIDRYKFEPKITEKQMEMFAFDKTPQFSPAIGTAFVNTLYYKNHIDAIRNKSEIVPYSLFTLRELLRFGLKIIASASQVSSEKKILTLNQGKLILKNSLLDFMASDIELFFRSPIYMSKRLEKRAGIFSEFARMSSNAAIPLPSYISDGINCIEKTVSLLKPGMIITPQPEEKISTAIKYHLPDILQSEFWKSVKDFFESSNEKNFTNTLLLSNQLDTTNIDTLIRSFDDTHDLLITNPPSFHCILKFPEELNSWTDTKVRSFITEFITKLELNNVGYAVFNYKQSGTPHIIEIIAQGVRFNGNQIQPVCLGTAYQRGVKALSQLEHKYGLEHNISQNQTKTDDIRHHINNHLNKNTNGKTPSPDKPTGKRTKL